MNLLRQKAIRLRHRGKTYTEIQNTLGVKIPKSTLSYWLKQITMDNEQQEHIRLKILKNAAKGRAKALEVNRKKRQQYLTALKKRNSHLRNILKNIDVAKAVLATLYLTEGSKTTKGSVVFGNSDPYITSLYIRLLRKCYNIDESKFRCTLQARADQNIEELEEFWSKVTKIPLRQFYKARIDRRTVGKPSKKANYKGVCRIDYLSADVLNELQQIAKIIHTYKGP